MTQFSYSIIRYRHDISTGETLNVGVVLFAPETGEVGIQYSQKYARLSEAFAGFDGDAYRSTMSKLESRLLAIAKPMSEGLFQLENREKFETSDDLIRSIWLDQGLAYYIGRGGHGISDDLASDLQELYDRFVLSQSDKREWQARFDDEAVWNQVRTILSERGIVQVLRPKTIGSAEVEFQHAYKNEKWHAIEAISLDYANPTDMKQKAYMTLGKATAVSDAEEFGSLTLFVGKPKRVELEKKYFEAMTLLASIPVPHTIVDAENAAEYAYTLEREMRAHGVLS